MAGLDEFFARRDKRKSKSKPRLRTVDDLGRYLDETIKGLGKKIKKPELVSSESSINSAKVASFMGLAPPDGKSGKLGKAENRGNEEERKKDFKQNQRKDYSGLKLVQLNLNPKSPTNTSPSADGDDDGVLEIDLRNPFAKSAPKGPWKTFQPFDHFYQIQSRNKYGSPGGRKGQNSRGAMPNKNKPPAPDLTNIDDFPTLMAACPEEQRKKKTKISFSGVRHGSRHQHVTEQFGCKTSGRSNRYRSQGDLPNKFQFH